MASPLQGAGAAISSIGQIEAGQAQNQQDQYQAAQLRVNAGQAMAAGSSQIAQQALQTKLIASRALAVAGSSGVSALSPGVLNIMANISKVGEYNQGMEYYNAQSKANGMLDQSSADIFSGQQAQTAGYIKAAGTIASAAGQGQAAGFNGWGT